MESIQSSNPTATRPPLPHRPPARVDREGPSSDHDKRHDTNPNVDIRSAYRRRSLKHRIECGHGVTAGPNEIEALKQLLGTRKCQMYADSNDLSCCVVCGDQCTDGEFAVETVLFIPNKNDAAYESLGRFRMELPRIACHECAKEHASDYGIEPRNAPESTSTAPLAAVWKKYQNKGSKQAHAPKLHAAHSTKSVGSARRGGSVDTDDRKEMGRTAQPLSMQRRHSEDSYRAQAHRQHAHQPPVHGHPSHGHSAHGQLGPQGHHNQGHRHQHQGSSQKLPMPMDEAETDFDPFDDGFLICTQLVKTGGADQGGLQVGDIFVEFGPYHLNKFPGLKAIANLVRRSAGKEIPVVVWRKLEV